MRIRDEQLINRFLEFMDDHEIKSIEDVYQQDKISEECVELVAELVGIMLGKQNWELKDEKIHKK